MKYIYLFLFLLAVVVGEGQNLSIPNTITKPEERAAYLVRHYWDGFDFADTANLYKPEVTEQALSDYLNLMKYVTPEMADSVLTQLVRKTEVNKEVEMHYVGLFEKYLYEPESPVCDEELYIPVLRAVLASPLLEEVDKVRPAYLLELVLRNRVGKRATDFVYTLADGQTGRLHGVEAEFLLLYFYDSDCHVCRETVRELSASPLVKRLISENRLKVLAVYTEGDEAVWRAHLPEMPADWIVSYDDAVSVKSEEIYDLKFMPTLYLLDKHKKVLLKGTTYEHCLDFLRQNM